MSSVLSIVGIDAICESGRVLGEEIILALTQPQEFAVTNPLLSPNAIDYLVPILNERINIPGIWDEDEEAAKIRSGLALILPAIPAAAVPFLMEAADGLTDAEVDKYVEITLNAAVRPVVRQLPSFAQAFIGTQLHAALEPMVRIIFEYAQAGANLGLEGGE